MKRLAPASSELNGPVRTSKLTPMRMLLQLIALLCLITGSVATAQVDLPPQPPEVAAPAIRELPDGRWMVGSMLLDKARGRLEIPARVNMIEGLVEYVLVHKTGKSHESLFVTDIQPYHVQIAMLLLGAKGADHGKLTNAPPSGPINNADLAAAQPPVQGTGTELTVHWRENGTNRTARVDRFMFDRKRGREMVRSPWNFTGSVVWQGAFIAQIEGSIIALITDVGAIFNSTLPDRDADATWHVRTAEVPRLNTPVTIRVSLKPAAGGSAGKAGKQDGKQSE